MRVTEVSTVVRYSAEAKGAWRSIEVGATATLTASDETLEVAQQELYARLSRQLKTLWANGNGKAETQEQPSNGSESPATTRQHFCMEHNQEFKKRTGPHGVFYSHQIKGTKDWCNERS
jgi:hypothetical protein